MRKSAYFTTRFWALIGSAFFIFSNLFASLGAAESLTFRLALTKTLESRETALDFYQGRGFLPIWTGTDASSQARRTALVRALENADTHGLPKYKYSLNRQIGRAHV